MHPRACFLYVVLPLVFGADVGSVASRGYVYWDQERWDLRSVRFVWSKGRRYVFDKMAEHAFLLEVVLYVSLSSMLHLQRCDDFRRNCQLLFLVLFFRVLVPVGRGYCPPPGVGKHRHGGHLPHMRQQAFAMGGMNSSSVFSRFQCSRCPDEKNTCRVCACVFVF